MPWYVVLPVLAAALATVRYLGWRGVVTGALVLGVLSGSVTAIRTAGECKTAWARGAKTAVLRIHDPPGSQGITTATVLHAKERCGGEISIRVDAERLAGGVSVVAVGTYRGGGVFRIRHLRVLDRRPSWRFALRDLGIRRIKQLYGERAGLVEALVIGRRVGIDASVRNSFVQAGLAHVLAISGLHVGVLAAWCLLLFRTIRLRQYAWLAACAAVWIYVGLLGFPAPATRAASFVTIVGVARTRQRHPPPSAVLAVAVLVVLALEPLASRSVGAWLSVAAVWGTNFGISLVPRWRLLGASVGATLATAPITAFWFGTVSPIGILANLVAVPLTGVVVPGLFLSLIFGDVLAGGTGLVLAAIEHVARVASAVPSAQMTGEPGVALALPWCALLAVVIWLRRGRWKSWRVGARRLLAAAVVVWLAMALPALVRRGDRDALVLHVLAVGQGDAIAIRTPGNRWVLVDGGPRVRNFDAGRRIVLPFLRKQGVTELAVMIVSHGDADHLGGVPTVLRTLSSKLSIEPGQALGSVLYLDYLETVDAVGTDWYPARAGDAFVVDSVLFEIIHPAESWISHQLSPNENSLVVRVSYRCFSALLTGDIGFPAESLLVASKVVGAGREGLDVLKVAHHGSAGSTGDAWLDAVRPAVAVISVGRNRYGHPAPAVLQRLAARGIPKFRTDRGGTVTIRTDGRYLEVIQHKSMSPWERIGCRLRQSSRSKNSSSSRNGCTPKPRVSLPACSTTSRSPQKSSRAMSGEPVSSTFSAPRDS